MRKWVALSEGAGGTVGWLTVRSCHRTIARPQALVDTLSPAPCAQTNERKEAMCFQTRDALRVGNIFLSEGFFSVLMEEREAIKTIQDELCRFAIITEPAKTLFGKIRKTYTGKLGGLQDDLAICLQLCVTGLRCFYQSDKYNSFRPEM